MAEVKFRSPFGNKKPADCVGLKIRHNGAVIGKVVRAEGDQLVGEVGNVEFLGTPFATFARPYRTRGKAHRWTKIGEGLHECAICETEAAGYDPRDTVPGPCPGKVVE